MKCVDTGQDTQTGGRLKRIEEYIPNGETFLFTYGDGVGDINITDVIKNHKHSKKIATWKRISILKTEAWKMFSKKGMTNEVL